MKRKSNITRYLRAAVTAALLGGCFGLSPAAYALPVGGVSSTAAIVVNGTTMNITGAENNLITWLDFSIGKGEKVAFDAHNYLNYVTGNAASEILGTLSGQGAIYLVNPNGISIGDGAVIDVGTLHLSTADLTGHLNSFSDALSAVNGATSFAGDVVNKGTLTAAKEITVQGKNISFKNIDHVKANGSTNNSNIKVYTNTNQIQVYGGGYVSESEVHVGYKGTTAPTINYSSNTTPMALKLISTPQELQNIKDDLNGRYMLENDIDMGDFSDFRPIGNGHHAGSEQDFTGRLDGLNYAIENLTMEFEATANTATGLFGKIGSLGRVENLILKNGKYNVTGSGLYSGGFVGVHKGILRNVTNDGMTISGTCVQGGGIAGHNCSLIDGATNNAAITINIKEQSLGGIVGKNSQPTSVIKNSVNTGNITSNKKYIGGIVGWNQNGKVINVSNHGTITGKDNVGGIAGVNAFDGGVASITNAANTGTVKATGSRAGGVTSWNGDDGILSSAYNKGTVTASSERAGGIVGANTGIVENVYNTGTVNGKMTNGGIVGENRGIANGKAVIRYAYNTGTVTGTQNIGGIFGLIVDNGKIANAYDASNMEASGTITSGTVDNVEKISQDDLLKASTFSGFSLTADGTDSSAVWRIYEGRTAPLLTAFMTPLRLADTTLIYDGQAHSVANLANVDRSKIHGNLPFYTQLGTYKYTGLQSLYSDQFGYNIIAPSDTATLTIEKGAEVIEQSVPAPSNPGSSSSSSSSSGSGSGSTSTPAPIPTPTPTPALTPIPVPVKEITPTAPVTTAAPAWAEPSTSTSIPATAQAVERQLEARGVDAGQLEAATNSVYPNVQSSTAAATLSAENRAEGARSANAPMAPARADLNLSWGADGLLTLENKGVNAPVSMQAETLAATAGNNGPATGSRTTASNTSQPAGSENAQGQESSQSDSADSTEKNDKKRDSE